MTLPAIVLSLMILLSSCGEQLPDRRMILHDIWALESIENRKLDLSLDSKRPVIEIYVAEMRMLGSGLCNNISSEIVILTKSRIEFGPILSTKMACSGLEEEQLLLEALEKVRSFRLEQLRLYLMDKNGKEILTFRKID